jgi:lipopolysaccharide export system permease protein
MKLYARHVLKTFLGLFLLVFLSAVVVYVVIDFVGNSREWLTRTPAERTTYYLNYLPYIAYLVCPISLLLAAVFSVGNLARHFELVALRAVGVSVTRIIAPVLWSGLLLSVAMFVLQDRVLPAANEKRFRIQEPGTGMFDAGGDPLERSEYLYTASDGTLLYFQHYSGQSRSGNIVTVMRLKNGSPVLRVDARTLTWSDSTRDWTFEDGTRRDFAGDSVKAETFGLWQLPGFSDPPEDLIDSRVYPDEMSMAELSRRIAVLHRNGEPSHLLRTHWHFRVASALVNLVMAALGALLAVGTVRTGLARNFGLGLLVTFLYYVALRIGLVMGEGGGVNPIFAAWFGNILFLPLTGWMWWKAARA